MEKLMDFLRHAAGIALLLLLAAAVGAVTGVLDAVFGQGVDLVTGVREAHPWLLVLLPAAGAAICFAYDRFGPECRKAIRLVFDAGAGRRQGVPGKVIPMAVGATWVSHLFGASVGREGVAVQMGATVGSLLGRPLRDARTRRNLLMAGVAAGFGGLFRTPLTATVFATELFHMGAAEYTALLPALVAACTASMVSGRLGQGRFSADLGELPAMDPATLVRVVVLGVVCGLVGALFARLMHRAHGLAEHSLPNPYVRILVAGAVAAAVGLLTGGRYNGVGETLLAAPFTGGEVYAWDWIAKMLLTVLCLSAGFQGGEVLPLFTIGATLGAVVAPVLGLPAVLGAGLGYTAVFCAGTDTFFAAVLVGGELFGMQYIPLFFVVCAVAYASNLGSSIYPQLWVDMAQLMEEPKE